MKKAKLRDVAICRDCQDSKVCVHCSGYGTVPHYTLDGSDFLGPKECKDCGGSGVCPWCPEDDDASGC